MNIYHTRKYSFGVLMGYVVIGQCHFHILEVGEGTYFIKATFHKTAAFFKSTVDNLGRLCEIRNIQPRNEFVCTSITLTFPLERIRKCFQAITGSYDLMWWA